MTHPIFGKYTVQAYPYKITFADGVEYNKKEAAVMAEMSEADKKEIHLFKKVFGGEIV